MEVEKRLATAVATVCDYICLDHDLTTFRKCREKCIKHMRKLIEELKQEKAFRD